MVIVMPPLSECQQPDNPLIVAPVVRLELALTKDVADRIDAPGDVVYEEHAYKSSPEQTSPAAKCKRDDQ